MPIYQPGYPCEAKKETNRDMGLHAPFKGTLSVALSNMGSWDGSQVPQSNDPPLLMDWGPCLQCKNLEDTPDPGYRGTSGQSFTLLHTHTERVADSHVVHILPRLLGDQVVVQDSAG